MILYGYTITTVTHNFRNFAKRFSSNSKRGSEYKYWINPFSTNVLLLYPLNTSENRRFSNVFRGYRSETLVENGLKSKVPHDINITSRTNNSCPGVFKNVNLNVTERPYVQLCVMLQAYSLFPIHWNRRFSPNTYPTQTLLKVRHKTLILISINKKHIIQNGVPQNKMRKQKPRQLTVSMCENLMCNESLLQSDLNFFWRKYFIFIFFSFSAILF